MPLVENGEAYFLDESQFKDNALVKEKSDELISHGYALSFTPDEILEMGFHLSRKEYIDKRISEGNVLSHYLDKIKFTH